MDDSAAAGILFVAFYGGLFLVSLFLCWLIGKFAQSQGSSFALGFLLAFFLTPIFGFLIVFAITAISNSNGSERGRMTHEELLQAEEIKLQRRRTELRWNFLYLLLFIGGAYYLYRHPGPLRPFRDKLLASLATPAPATPVPLPRFATATEAQQEAVRRYPALGVSGSPFHRAFLSRHKLYQQQRPEYFQDNNWPITLAQEISSEINSK